MAEINKSEALELLKAAVSNKKAYWDSMGALEAVITGGEFTDEQNDAAHKLVESLAAAGGVGDVELEWFLNRLNIKGE